MSDRAALAIDDGERGSMQSHSKLLVLLPALIMTSAAAATDCQRMSDCAAHYSQAYCAQACTIDRPVQQQATQPNVIVSFIEGRRERKGSDLRRQQLEQSRAKQRRNEDESDRLQAQAAKEVAEAQDRERLRTENAALKRKLEKASAEKSTELKPRG